MKHDVQTGPDVRFALRAGVEKLAGAVSVTMGPRGRNVVLGSALGAPTITKDGVTVAREIELDGPIENMGAQMVKLEEGLEKAIRNAPRGTPPPEAE